MKKKLRKQNAVRKKAVKNAAGVTNNRHKAFKKDCNSKEFNISDYLI